jgi:4-hydroxy-2-oxoheptanedioate aldolase
MNLRKSSVLRKIKEGKTAYSLKLNLADPRGAEIAAMSGIDCIWIDMEHTPTDYYALENIVRAAKIYDVDILTRVKRGSYSDLVNPLEADFFTKVS